jgi:peptide/nickel transport system substrate-binding protein
VLQRFDKYRNAGPKGAPPIRNITIRIIPDMNTQAAEVMSGGVNWTFEIPTEIAEGAAQSGQAQLVSGPSMRTFYISLDAAGKVQKDGPLTKLKVRQALNHALDREGIVKNLLKGSAQVLHTPCVPVQFGCDEAMAQKYPYDSAKAKALLAEEGYANGFDLDLWAARDKAIVEAIASQWRAVGIRANVRLVKGPTLSEARRVNQIPAEFASSGSFGVPDAGAILPDRLGPGSARNYSGDDKLGQMIMRAVSTYDEAERKSAFDEAVKRTTEQAYWVPLYTESQDFLMTKDLSYSQASDGMARLFLVRWK